LLQALSLEVQTYGGGPDVLHVAARTADFQSPRTTADAVKWYQAFGATRPDKLAHIGQGAGLQGANSDWLWALPPAGMFRGTMGVGGYLLGAVRGAATNIVLTAAAEKAAEKFGPAAGAVVPYVPILVAILGHRGIGGAAFRRLARRYTTPKQELASTIGGEAINAAEFAKIKAAFEKNGGSILQNADVDAYLLWRAKQMGASNVGGLTHNAKEILLPTNATRTAVFEELIHTAQFRTGKVKKLIERFGNAGAERLLEIEAAEKLIQNQRAWQLPQSEIDEVAKRLEQLRKQGGK
jgi:hypothetical protein